MSRSDPAPSALHVARRRAAHQAFDVPRLIEDEFVLRLFGLKQNSTPEQMRAAGLRAPARLSSRALRAFQVARARFAEDAVHAGHADGVRQYVVLAAGLDTFALRCTLDGLRVLEVDLPATQSWKRDLLEQRGIPVPPTLSFVPFDLHEDGLHHALTEAGLTGDSAVVSAMGVVPYLTDEAFQRVMMWAASLPHGSALVLDYRLPASALPEHERRELASLSSRVAAAGEAFRLLLTPDEMRRCLQEAGLVVVYDEGAGELNARYFPDALAAGTGALLVTAEASRVLLARRAD